MIQRLGFKKILIPSFSMRVCAVLLLLSSLLLAGARPAAHKSSHRQVWEGYLLDALCARERSQEPDLAQKHTQKCLQMPSCDRSGFGILVEGNLFLKFDQNGDAKVRALLSTLHNRKPIRIRVAGTSSGQNLISIARLELAK